MPNALRKALLLAAQAALIISILFFSLAALNFIIHGLTPASVNVEGAEGTYKIVGERFTLDWLFVRGLGASEGVARTLGGLTVGLFCALIAYLFVQAVLLVRSIGAGGAFTDANARRLARMGWIIVLPVSIALVWRASQSTLTLEPLLTLAFLAALGITLILIGGVFRDGSKMRDDLEGTV